MDNITRRTLIPTFLPPLMTSRYYLSFALLTRALHPVMTVSTNACLKLGLLHHLFPFSCHAINGRKTHVVCCRGSSDISLHHKRCVNLSRTRCTFRFPRIFCARLHSSSRSCLLLLLLLALHIVQAHISVYVCAQYNALTPRPLDECNNVYAPLQDQLSMGFMMTNYENMIRYNSCLPNFPRIDLCSNCSNGTRLRSTPGNMHTGACSNALHTIIMSRVRNINLSKTKKDRSSNQQLHRNRARL